MRPTARLLSTAAGSKGTHKGVAFVGATWDFAKNGYLRVDGQHGEDVFSTFYVDAKVPIAIDAQTSLSLGAQYTRQKSTGKETIGSFSTYAAGLQAVIARGPFSGQLYYTQVGKGFDTQNPFGSNASYLDLQQVAFNTAGERAWGIGSSVNFASFGRAGGRCHRRDYASSRDRTNAGTGASFPDRQETDLRATTPSAADAPEGTGGNAARIVAASGGADGVPVARHPQLRRSF